MHSILNPKPTGNGGQPKCHLCILTGAICTYPRFSLKPGPKKGSKRARRDIGGPAGNPPHAYGTHELPSELLQTYDDRQKLQAPLPMIGPKAWWETKDGYYQTSPLGVQHPHPHHPPLRHWTPTSRQKVVPYPIKAARVLHETDRITRSNLSCFLIHLVKQTPCCLLRSTSTT